MVIIRASKMSEVEVTASVEGTAGVEGIVGVEGTEGMEGTVGVEGTANVLSEVNLDDSCKPLGENEEAKPDASHKDIVVTIGATVPTGFELTAADEVQEKLGSQSRISKDRGKIYFDIPVNSLPQVCRFLLLMILFINDCCFQFCDIYIYTNLCN